MSNKIGDPQCLKKWLRKTYWTSFEAIHILSDANPDWTVWGDATINERSITKILRGGHNLYQTQTFTLREGQTTCGHFRKSRPEHESILLQIQSSILEKAELVKDQKYIGVDWPPTRWVRWSADMCLGIRWIEWAYQEGFFNDGFILDVPEAISNAPQELEQSSKEESQPEIPGRREQQHEIILAVIAALEFDAQQIPDGGKSKIKSACLTRPRLFTPDSFDHAWKAGVAAGLFKLANHDKFSPK